MIVRPRRPSQEVDLDYRREQVAHDKKAHAKVAGADLIEGGAKRRLAMRRSDYMASPKARRPPLKVQRARRPPNRGTFQHSPKSGRWQRPLADNAGPDFAALFAAARIRLRPDLDNQGPTCTRIKSGWSPRRPPGKLLGHGGWSRASTMKKSLMITEGGKYAIFFNDHLN